MKNLAYVLALAFTLPALADNPSPPPGGPGKGPCAADREKFCPGIKPGDGKFMKCMKDHESQLSEGCKEMAAKMKGKMGARRGHGGGAPAKNGGQGASGGGQDGDEGSGD